ncbi:zinc finger CCCH domain-containing protein 67 [Amaranthus tricolor]|uniref:zinc finger CCCH domain-containing protein 67 n=1 Tax=Amaranthus tricolor TaxID=29722 RepID=UPI002585E883|nr:zinc finger CCCH domain-containing protein 67 [Amaranthus tricolor]
MELGLQSSSPSSITCPLGLSIHQNNLQITSVESDSPSSPSLDHDHHQSSESVGGELTSLSIHDTKVEADDNGEGDCDRRSEDREDENNEEEKGEIEDESKNEERENGVEEEGNGEIENVIKNEEREKDLSRRKSNNNTSRFPLRPDAEDCSFFVRNGTCKFGMNCKFNHPSNHRKYQGVKVKVKEESAESASQKVKENDESLQKEQIDCKYFDRPGGCKFGKACKFNHSRKTNSTFTLNFMGLPIRPGEKECPFYMRNGSCKFAANCRFNHPDPTSIGGPDALPKYGNGGSVYSPNASQSNKPSWSPPPALNESPPYVSIIFPPTQGVPMQPEWNAYQAQVYQPQRSMHLPPTYTMNNQLPERPEQMLGDDFPERPGQPECSYFVKNGNCKYKSACKFHHPKRVMAVSPSCHLSDLGLPLRPGENVCSYYSRYGICKYGPACKYDHPINHVHSPDLSVSEAEVDQTPVIGDSRVNNQAIAMAASS